MSKQDCYQCEYRGEVPGDAHSCCCHPFLGKKDSNTFVALGQLMLGEFREGIEKLNIKANPHGVRMGWFIFPANFDPVWLENCDGFKEK